MTVQFQSSVTASTEYMSGFGNSFETEALPGALPVGVPVIVKPLKLNPLGSTLRGASDTEYGD